MGIPVLIIGKSGSGKSASMRNLKADEAAIINVMGKTLPFRNELKTAATTDYTKIKKWLSGTDKKINIIDDAGYLITDHFMTGHSKAGKGSAVFDLYNDIGDNFYELIRFIPQSLPKDHIVYIIMHEDRTDAENIKPKTIGKVLDEKVCLEGLFTIVLRSTTDGEKYVFLTRTTGNDVTKTPIGMFEEAAVDNDIKLIDDTIRNYYQSENEEEN